MPLTLAPTLAIDELIQLRRHFHQYPELGWCEFYTTATLHDYLTKLGLPVYLGEAVLNPNHIQGRDEEQVKAGIAFAKHQGVSDELLNNMHGLTGCVTEIDSGKPGKTIAIRVDIDCVNVSESRAAKHKPNQQGFASTRAGLMHACGHDGHSAIGLGVAKWLVNHKDAFKGKVKIFFQPAEEGVRGASAMAHSPMIEDVDQLLGLHLGFIARSGEVVADPTHFLCTTKFDLFFEGKPAHAGASPQQGNNALAAACHCATQLLGISRHGEGMSRINVGTISAGEGRNVIPAHGKLELEVRGENQHINDYMAQQVQRIAQGCALSFDVDMRCEVVGSALDLSNDAALITQLTDIVKRDPQLTLIPQRTFGGSEDATLLAHKVQQQGGQALYFVVGANLSAGHHKAEFDFDEQQLLTAAKLLISLITQARH